MRYWFILSLFLLACGSKQVKNEPSKSSKAKFFSISKNSDTLKLQVLSSQRESKVLFELQVLNGKVRKNTGEWKLIEKCLLSSASQLGAFKLLNSIDKVQGFNNIIYAYDEEVRKRMNEGVIKQIGEMNSFNEEVILKMNPDIILYSAEVSGSAEFKLYESQGILMIPIIEWREESALARAEWIKFYGAILGKQHEADSIFNIAKKEYKALIPEFKTTSTTMAGNDYKGVWYTPAGESYLAKMMNDAGGLYEFADSKGNGSLSKDFEVIVQRCGNNDYWINPGIANNLDQLIAENPKYKLFKSVKEKKVFNHVARKRKDGSNDYWEAGVYQPHLVLKDYIKIFRGETDGLYFYQQLN